MIAFDRDDELYVMNADGSGKRRLMRADGCDWARGRSPLGLVARAEVVRSERRVGSAAPEASSARPPRARAPRS